MWLNSLLTSDTFLISVVTLTGALFRTILLNMFPPGLYIDEAYNGLNVLEILETGKWQVFYPENWGREGLFINLQAISVRFFGNKPWALRLVSTVFGTLTVPAVYLLAKKLFASQKVAFWSGFAVATSFWHIIFSRIGFRAIMGPCFFTWGVYLFIAACDAVFSEHDSLKDHDPADETGSNPKGKRGKVAAIMLADLAGMVYGLGFHSYIGYRVTPILILWIMWYYWKWQNPQRRSQLLVVYGVFCLATFLVVLPLLLYFFSHPSAFFGRAMSVSVFSFAFPFEFIKNVISILCMFHFVGDKNWRHNLAHDPEMSYPMGIALIVGVIVLGRELYAKIRTSGITRADLPSALLFLSTAVLSLPGLLSGESPHALRVMMIIPAVHIMVGVGIDRMVDFGKKQLGGKKRWMYAIIAFFMATVVFTLIVKYFEAWGRNGEVRETFCMDHTRIAREIMALPRDVPKYVFHDGVHVDPGDGKTKVDIVLEFLMNTWNKAQFNDAYNISCFRSDEAVNVTIPAGAYVANISAGC